MDRPRTMNIDRDHSTLQVQLVWSPNALKGYAAAVLVLVVIMLVSKCTRVEPPTSRPLPPTTPLTVLILGDGDGTGQRKGNLAAEGAAQRGAVPKDPLTDASKAAASSRSSPANDLSQSTNLQAVPDVGAPKGDTASKDGAVTVGGGSGDQNGTGLGLVRAGKGKGLGYGDIDWGGGGNRIVLHKVKPMFPPGTMNTEVRLRFRVRPDGSVSMVVPVRKGGNPAADQAASHALRQWRFNPLNSRDDMEGTITFVFRGS